MKIILDESKDDLLALTEDMQRVGPDTFIIPLHKVKNQGAYGNDFKRVIVEIK